MPKQKLFLGRAWYAIHTVAGILKINDYVFKNRLFSRIFKVKTKK